MTMKQYAMRTCIEQIQALFSGMSRLNMTGVHDTHIVEGV